MRIVVGDPDNQGLYLTKSNQAEFRDKTGLINNEARGLSHEPYIDN